MNDSDFADLHVHSHYSLLDGAASPDHIVEKTAQLGRKYLTLTDHGSIDGWLRFQKSAKEKGIKPCFGIELYMLERFEERHEGKHENLHLTAIAKTPVGIEKLIRACGFAHTEGMGKHGYAARPFLPIDWPIVNNWAGDVIITTGCASSPFWKTKDGPEILGHYAEAFKGDLYAETMPIHDWDVQKDINAAALEAARYFGIKPVVTTDSHYINQEDHEFHEVVLGLSRKNMTWNNPDRWKFSTHTSHIHSTDQLLNSLFKMGWPDETIRAAILNTREVAEKCVHEIPPTPIKLPRVVDVPDDQENAYFTQLVFDGLGRRGVLDKPGYMERAANEIELFEKKGFVRYMLMVWDVVRWAKAHGILVGPARGSVGGSLVAYALGIMDLDPIKYRLWFERFLDPGRNDLPDIDVDVEDRNRHLVEQYLKEKYGQWNVAHVSTFSTMLGKMAVKDVGRLFEVPLPEVQRMCNSIVKQHESDARAHMTIQDTIASGDAAAVEFAKKYPHVVRYAAKLEGQIRGYGIHAAGFVISDEDLRTSNRTYLVNRKDKLTINWDKIDAETMGFVKLDLLGVSTLSAVAEAIRLIEQRRGVKLDMNAISLDDRKTYEMISRGETMTCFQLGTPGISKYCAKLKPDNFEHLAAITALWRPGPITSGAADMYAKCKNGLEPVNYSSDAFRSITEISYGQMIYQEQVVQMLMKLAGYTYSQADKVRKIVSKKGGVQAWDNEEPKFLEGCRKIGIMAEEPARALWQSSKMFALYAFNRAHSVGYGMLAYWTAYLKANYPAEWFCAYLNYGSANKEDAKTGEINRDVALRETHRSGIDILAPDINDSEVIWTVSQTPRGKPAIRVGLMDVKFVGEAAIEQIQKLKSRVGSVASLDSFLGGVDRRAVHKKVVKALLFCGALDSVIPEGERERWFRQYEEMYESLDAPKKRAALLAEPVPEGELKEILDRERKVFLRFDPLALEASNAGEVMAKIVGGELDLDPEEATIRRGDLAWTVSDAASGEMPGATGVLTQTTSIPSEELAKATRACKACSLRKTCKGPVPFERGNLNLMIVAEAPGKNEEVMGRPLIGDAGSVLWSELAAVGIQRSDVWISNAVKCRPPLVDRKNTKPTPEQIDGCMWLDREIKHVRPRVILSLGNTPLYYFTGREHGIIDANGTVEWNHKAQAWVVYCIHPAMVLYRDESRGQLQHALREFARLVVQFA